MEWLTCIKEAIDYMEANLLSVKGPEEVAAHVNFSVLYLQRGFQIITGYNIGEYIRNRRLYQAALELCNTDKKVIDVAFEYGYETPESFTKAFTRFHGVSPSEIRSNKETIRIFLPLKIKLSVQGGDRMNFTVEKMDAIKMIGFVRNFNFENSHTEIPRFWDEIGDKYGKDILLGKKPVTTIEKAMRDNCIGEYGICIDDIGSSGEFRYMIAGKYNGGEVPEEMEVYDVPAFTWAKFNCTGAMPTALQTVNDYIWNEWLPGNKEYELDGNVNIEWYSGNGKPIDKDYQSAIWMPVRKK